MASEKLALRSAARISDNEEMLNSLLKTFTLCFFLLLALTPKVYALIPDDPGTSTVRHFFKNPESLFPSGEATLSSLIRNHVSERQQNWALVSTLSYRQWLDREDLIFPEEIKVLSTTEMEAITLEATRLFVVRNNKAVSVAIISSGERLTIYGLQGPWARTQWRGSEYLVFSDHLITPIDFAAQITTQRGENKNFNYRKGDRIFLRDQDFPIEISQVQNFISIPSVAILKRDIKLPPEAKLSQLFKGQRLLVEKLQTSNWMQSIVEGHGAVWWRSENEKTKIAGQDKWLTTKELIGKSIHDFSRASTKSTLALASSDGIFLTQDGKSWRQLNEFGNQNWPVAISKDNTLFVGSRLSKNLGADFSDFVNWEDVAFKTQVILGKPPQFLLLRKIKLANAESKKVILEIDTGWKVLNFSTTIPTGLMGSIQ